MKLERLDELKKVTVKQMIVDRTIMTLRDRPYYSRFELEAVLAVSLFAVFGDTELHKAMYDDENADWLSIVEENYNLIKELSNSSEYIEILKEIERMAEQKAAYNRTIGHKLEGLLESLMENEQFKNLLERDEVKEVVEQLTTSNETEPAI